MRPPQPLSVIVLTLVLLAVVAGCSASKPETASQTPPADPRRAPAPSGDVASSSSAAGENCEYVPSGVASKPVELPPASDVPTSGVVTFTMKFAEGDVTITMDRSKAPCTINSFESLANQRFFDGTRCHRLTDSGRLFVLQCGDPTGTSMGGPGYTFADETDGTESYTRGVVAMANGGPNTNGSQFFIIWQDSTGMDVTPNYTIFGTVDMESVNVVARIAAEGQDGSNPSGGGTPNNPAEIISVNKR